MTQLWRESTLTDRGRMQEDPDEDGSGDASQDPDQDAAGGEEKTGQTDLGQW